MENNKKRSIKILVLSDIHLGTYGCHAKELLQYLKSISPEKVILNGDIIDIWQFKKRYFPKSHMKIIKHIVGWISKGIPVHYITGNHDEMLRKFEGFQLGSFKIHNQYILNIDNTSCWFFHGDVFDITMQHARWLTKVGAIGYDFLILVNTFVNFFCRIFGRRRVSLSKKIKDSVKGAVSFVNSFEKTVTDNAIAMGYDKVFCGHIHQAQISKFSTSKGSTVYLNSGDWVENLTALEYNDTNWQLYTHPKDALHSNITTSVSNKLDTIDQSPKELFQSMLNEFNLQK
ncbi:MAG: UDP-2,3-diacylglucosamine diphosphatase [Flavicella sp.]